MDMEMGSLKCVFLWTVVTLCCLASYNFSPVRPLCSRAFTTSVPPGMCWGGTLCCSRLTAPFLSDLYLINTGKRLGKVRELHFPSLTLLNWERNLKKERKSSFLNFSLTKLFCNGPFNAQRDKERYCFTHWIVSNSFSEAPFQNSVGKVL